MENLQSILTPASKPKLTQNESDPDNIRLITPFMQADKITPKTDLNMRPVGSIMLSQEKFTMNGGFLNVATRYAFLSSTVESLEMLLKRFELKHGSELPGQIIVMESLAPFFDGQHPKINPSTKQEIAFEVGGTRYPVFYQTRYTEDMKAKDITIRSVEDVIGWLDARNMRVAEAKAEAAVVETSNIPVTETVGA